KRVGETYKNMKSYHFEMMSVTETKVEAGQLKSLQRTEEAFIIAAIKPDRSRVETKSPNLSIVTIYDGKTNWVYVPALKKYLKRTVETAKTKKSVDFDFDNLDSGLEFFGFDIIGMLARQPAKQLIEYEQIANGVKEAKLLREE